MTNSNKNSPLVSIVCTTYNHEKFIRQTIDGFLLQKTSFPLEIIIHDDASNDSTGEILKEYEEIYPNLFRNIYQKENIYSKGINIWSYLFSEKVRGKYIALCEGDDYWTDPLKLQKQIDFLEDNRDYGLVYTKVREYLQSENRLGHIFGGKYTSFIDILHYNPIPTLSVCFRKDLYFSYINEILVYNNDWKMSDYPLWLYLSKNSKVKYMDFISGVYRVLDNSASHNLDVSKQLAHYSDGFQIADFYINKYTPENEILKFHFQVEHLWFCFRLFCIRKEWNLLLQMQNKLNRIKKINIKISIMKATCLSHILFILMHHYFLYRSQKK